MSRTRTLIAGGTVAVLIALWLAPPDYLQAYLGKAAEEEAIETASQLPPQPAAIAEEGDPALVNPLHELSLSAFDEMVKRPLFNQTRAPRPEPVAAAETETEAEPAAVPQVEQVTSQDFTLLGVSIKGEEKFAMIRWNKTNEVFHLREGQYLSDWELRMVEDKAVTIARADGELSIKLFAPAQPASVDHGENNAELAEDQ